MFQIIWYNIKSIEVFNPTFTWFCSFWLSWKDWIEPYVTSHCSRNDCIGQNVCQHINPGFCENLFCPPGAKCNPRIASWCSLLLFASQSTNQALGRKTLGSLTVMFVAYLEHIQQIRNLTIKGLFSKVSSIFFFWQMDLKNLVKYYSFKFWHLFHQIKRVPWKPKRVS